MRALKLRYLSHAHLIFHQQHLFIDLLIYSFIYEYLKDVIIQSHTILDRTGRGYLRILVQEDTWRHAGFSKLPPLESGTLCRRTLGNRTIIILLRNS